MLGNINLAFFNSAGAQIGSTLTIGVVILVPLSLTATAKSATEIDLAWSSVSTATSYDIEQSTDGGKTWSQPVNVTTTTYQDGVGASTPLTGGATYYFQVRADNAGGDSPWCTAVSATTFPPAPVISSAVVVSGVEIDITWNTVAAATSYQVFYAQQGQPFPATPQATLPQPNPLTPSMTYQVMGLTPNTIYNFEVVAVNNIGASPSTVVSAQTSVLVLGSTYTMTTVTPRIYYSTAPSDSISSKVQTTTQITIQGFGAKVVPPAPYPHSKPASCLEQSDHYLHG